MGRIGDKFEALRGRKEKALIVYLTAGDPLLCVTKKLILGLEKVGVDILEIGVSFSDPTADGPAPPTASVSRRRLPVSVCANHAAAQGLTVHVLPVPWASSCDSR